MPVEAIALAIGAPLKCGTVMESNDAIKTNIAIIMRAHRTKRPTLDSAAPNPANGKSHLWQTKTEHPI